MRPQIAAEFAGFTPRAIVLDDHGRSRRMTARRLRARGFDVVECASVEDFCDRWAPGSSDLIIADWQLSDTEHGDAVLASVRLRDWEVPFVLVSGKLSEDERRVKVLEVLLEEGAARFVTRGDGGIAKACDEGESLIERRDLALLKVILALRAGARQDAIIRSSGGPVGCQAELDKLLAAPSEKAKVLGSLASLQANTYVKG